MFGRKKTPPKPTCKHRWHEVHRIYQPSAVEELGRGHKEYIDDLAHYRDDKYRLAMFGQTTIELVCMECGDIRFRTVAGKSLRGATMID